MGVLEPDLFPNPDAPPRIASVVVPVPVADAYSYSVPEDMTVQVGSIVRVPLGPREVIGVVRAVTSEPGVDPGKLKPLLKVYDQALPLSAEMLRFIDWVAHWTLSAPGIVMRMVLRSEVALEGPMPMPGVRRVEGVEPERMTRARARILALTEDGLAWSKGGLARAAGVSPSVVDGLIAQGALEAVAMMPSPPPAPEPNRPGPTLTKAQAQAAGTLTDAIGEGFSVFLLDGVTGSGKTEVYLEAVAEVLRHGGQALLLLPEIALTGDFLDRFESRFGARAAEWHSLVPAKRRAAVWRGVASGDVKVVVGARSALFLPFRNLGLIVVDEEHDGAYKQDDGVPYNARDMAVVRAHISKFPVVLASATPSVESRVNADIGRYRRLELPERASGAALPTIEPIDMRTEGPDRGRWLAPRLAKAVAETVADGGQALLFLNRRGYAPLTLCRTCGYRFQCPDCSAWLVEHRLRGRMMCHHCGHSEPLPEACPSCGSVDSLAACGPGVERVAEEVGDRFPEARVLVLSSDLAGGAERIRREMQLIAEGRVDVVVGTQLVAKGHNFPLMRLVGVVDADLGLAHGDPRAAERTFQLLAQVTGRAGRVTGGGRGLLQTYAPEHPVIRALLSGDSDAFYQTEIESRRSAGLPPFGRLAALIVSGPDKNETAAFARAFARAAPSHPDVMLLGPAEAPLALVRGRHRFRLLVHTSRTTDLQAYLRHWRRTGPRVRGAVRLQVDIDPQSFL